MFLLHLLPSPVLNDVTEQKRELIHRVVTLADEYGQNETLALAIIKCESDFNFVPHTNTDGSEDIGYWQINDVHKAGALSRGFDLNNPDQNLEFGMVMLKEDGLPPWGASRSCWQHVLTPN